MGNNNSSDFKSPRLPSNLSKEDLLQLYHIINSSQSPDIQQKLRPLYRYYLHRHLVEQENILDDFSISNENLQSPSTPQIIPFDATTYFKNQIKGLSSKLRSIKSMTQKSTKEITNALICCSGSEEKALNTLIGIEDMPPFPSPPQDILDQHEKRNNDLLAKFEEELKHYQKNISSNQQEIKNADQHLAHLQGNPQSIEQFKAHLIKKINQQKIKNENLRRLLSSNPTTHSTTAMSDFKNKEDPNRIYLHGEYEAIQSGENRVYKFYPERTFSNNVSQIHFRMAESQFMRLLPKYNQNESYNYSTLLSTNNSNYYVNEVHYIVNSSMVLAFDDERRRISKECEMDFHQVKPLLMFSFHQPSDLKYIKENNYPIPDDGRIFSTDSKEFFRYISDNTEAIIFSLVLAGKLHRSSSIQRVRKPMEGFDSVGDGVNQVKIWNPNQVLPFYIVYFQRTQHRPNHFGDEWQNIEKEAKTDHLQNQVQEFYKEKLVKAEKERDMGEIDPTQAWFQTVYQRRYESEREKGVMFGEETPTGSDELAYSFETMTPITDTDISGVNPFEDDDEMKD